MFKKLIIMVLLATALSAPALVKAQSNLLPQSTKQLEAVVVKIIEEKKSGYQRLDLLVTNGASKGKHIEVENGAVPVANPLTYQAGDNVMVTVSSTPGGRSSAYISDYLRRGPLYLLFAIFIALALIVTRGRGLRAIVGMGISFLVIFSFVLPNILIGNNPIQVVIFAALFIVPITFYIAHGINKKTTAAIIGTLITIIITGVLASVFIQAARLTGTASEEAAYLTQLKQNNLNLQGILFAGILIAVLGILNDITVSQAAIVAQLKRTSQSLSFKDLYFKAMSVGKDHIASMINTLILVYTGTALPLLLLFVNNPHPFAEIINYEIVAEEVVSTLLAGIGLILAVPLTTLIACFFYSSNAS